MKRIILTLLCLPASILFTGDVMAQQDPYTTHYAFNRMMYNPAVAGSLNKFCVTALSHYQYVGYEDRTPEFYPSNGQTPAPTKGVGPKTQMFSFTAPVTKYGGLGIGFMNDKLGYESATHVKIDAAGILPLQSGAFLSLGVEMNILQKGLDGKKLKPLAPGDPSVPNDKVTSTKNIFGAGAYYIDPMSNAVSTRNLWFGLSALNLNKPTFEYQTGASSVVFHTPSTHYYMMGGISLIDFMGKPDLIFHPSVMFKYNTVFQADLTALVEYQKKLWGGIAYRNTTDAISIILGYSGFKGNLKGLRVGYSYDLTMSRILTVSNGSHEIQLNYCFEIVIPEKVTPPIITPPFMRRDSD